MEPADGLHRQVGTFQRCRSTTFVLFFCPLSLMAFVWVLSQRASDRPPDVERREWAEGVHQRQHPPTLSTVVLGRIPPEPALTLYFPNKDLTCSPPNHVSGVRVGCGLQRAGGDGPRGLAVRRRLPHVRHRQRSKSTQSETSVTFFSPTARSTDTKP